MIEKWFSTIELKLSSGEWQRLPRSSAYRYERIDGRVILTPRLTYRHAMLDLAERRESASAAIEGPIAIDPLTESDWPALPAVFADAFRRVQPFESLDDDVRLQAAAEALQQTREGGDGPLIPGAGLVATSGDDAPIGAILITLLPKSDDPHAPVTRWREPPAPNVVARGLGVAHLTWVFVSAEHSGRGVASALLAASVSALREREYSQLLTTFLPGNDSSLLWHWRNGFRLLPASARSAIDAS